MFQKFSLLILLLILSSMVLSPLLVQFASFSVQANVTPTSCPANDTLRIGLEPIPQNINSLTASGDSSFDISEGIEQLSLAPFPLDPNGSLWWQNSITDWITTNSNFTQWTFNIRPGLQWSNGQNVTAQDIASWLSPNYALNPQYDFVGLHSEIVNVKVLNASALTVYLNVSDAHLGERASTYYYAPVVPPSDVAQGPNASYLGSDVAVGPFYESNYTSGGTSMIMLRNPYFHYPTPAACAIDVSFVESSADMVPLLLGDAIDYASELAFGNVAALAHDPNIHIAEDPGWLGTSLDYNITEYPYNMTQFRQALASAINSSAIVQESLFGYGVPSNNAQGEVPSTFASYTPNQQQYPYNISNSLSLLHSIGFTGGGSTPLKFPNGTQVSTVIYTDSDKSWDIGVTQQVAGFLQQLGMGVQTQTLTKSNLASDYTSNAFNIRNNLVIYTSGGPYYVDPWIDAQQGCDIMGTPGCYGWQATPSADGQTHWEYPPSADVEYQGNLTAIDSTDNLTQEHAYLNNIEALNAQYLPTILLCYPDELAAYNTAHWTNWPTPPDLLNWSIDPNATALAALVPVSSSQSVGTTNTSNTQETSSPSLTSAPSSTSTTSSPSSSSSVSTTPASTPTTPTSSVTSTTPNNGTIELAAAVVIVIIIIGGVLAFTMRRRGPPKT